MNRFATQMPLAALLVLVGIGVVWVVVTGTQKGVVRSGASTLPSLARGPMGLGMMRGVCWEAQGRIQARHLQPVREIGSNWISQTPFGWCRSLTNPWIGIATTEGIQWGETDAGLVQTTVWAREMGLRTLLKPHLWVWGGEWVGDLEMKSDEDWQRWFRGYEAFILHYARLAELHGMEALAIGTEICKATTRTQDWRRLIARVREVYRGPITYCANWGSEVEQIEFWDDLDFIGVQAYYPLGDSLQPTPEEIRAAWGPVVVKLENLAKKTGKSVVFTEVGYKSLAGALRDPWSWNARGNPDLRLQRDAYRALFETFWELPWFGGTFIWKWHPQIGNQGRALRDFTPQGKPALEVIRSYYRQ